MKDISELDAPKRFISSLGKNIEKYFGNSKACIVYLHPDGVFYAYALHAWLKKKKKDILITAMEDDGSDLEEDKVQGRKVLIIDNDIVTGKAIKRVREVLRLRIKRLDIQGVKVAVFVDRIGIADFFVEKYSPERIWRIDNLDATDLKIIHELSQDGRKAFAEIGKKVKLSAVAVKNRVARLEKDKLLVVRGRLQIDGFYSVSANIRVDADSKAVDELVERLRGYQEIYSLVRSTGRYNLVVGVLGENIHSIQSFIDDEIRKNPGVRTIDVLVGDLPVWPSTIRPRF